MRKGPLDRRPATVQVVAEFGVLMPVSLGSVGGPMQVYITQTGTRYHGRTDQSCLENARGTTAVDLGVAIDGGLRPCLVCDAPQLPNSTEGDRRWLRAVDDWHRSGAFESMWEEAFARRILSRLTEITADDVEPQAYINSGSEAFKVDFLIPSAQVVLEVDGFAKSTQPISPTDLERRNRRDATLQSLGYTVLHFTNAQVQEEPSACADTVRAAVKGARKTQSPSTALNARAFGEPQRPAVTSAVPVTSVTSAVSGSSGMGLRLGFTIAAIAIVIFGVIIFVAMGSGGDSPSGASGAPDSTEAIQPEGGSMAPTATPERWVDPESQSACPTGYDFKANDNGLVHPPDNEPYYSKTTPERCYASLSDAQADGYELPEKYDGRWVQ